MKKPLIIANWKSNPQTVEEAVAWAREIERGVTKFRNVEVVIAPPHPFLYPVKKAIKKAGLGAQNVFWASGPYTGETSWEQIKNLGTEYIIVGHSERRYVVGETEEQIEKKTRVLLINRVKAILCVGERERVDKDIPETVGEQLKSALVRVGARELVNLIVAYEPVWAISTNRNSRPDTPENAFQARLYIQKVLAGLYNLKIAAGVKIIYGGSVNSQNVVGFFKEGRMEGALVGGASLNPREFIKIVERAAGA